MPNYILTGHVDHGKSTLCGRLIVNYTEQDPHYLEKLRQSSPNNWLGQIFDIYDEERERNKTFEWSKIEVSPITLFDTPGHKTFIREFLQALTKERINGCILCISGKPDEFESGYRLGEVKEYLKLIRATGITTLIIVWTKTIPSEKDKNDLEKFTKSLGFNFETFRVDSVNNTGIESLWNYLKGMVESEEILIENIIETQKVRGEIRFFIESIYCNGYRGIAHSQGDEVDFEINKLRLDNKIVGFINSGKNKRVEAIITFEKPIKVGKRIILRNEKNETIGFVQVK
jgi:hypothetical protein